MNYGSSPLLGIKLKGITGPTGPTGSTGPVGNPGTTGLGKTGSTGPSITGMTLNSQGFITTIFENNTIETAINKLRGETGNYYIPADADVLSTALNIVKGVSYFYDTGESILNVIKLRGFTTASPDVFTLTTNTNNNINIDYSIANLAYLGISGGSIGQIVYNKPGDKQYGLTGTNYYTTNNAVNAQIANYSERIIFIDPIYHTLGAATGFYYWNIDYTKGNIYKLNPWANDPGAGALTVVAQIFNIKSPENESVSNGLTIIVPSGVTSSNSTATLYATTENLSTPDINNLEQSISWPLTIAPCLTENVDIINLISVGDVWYGNFSHLGFTFNAPLDVVGDVGKIPTGICFENVNFRCASGNNLYGICCSSICGITAYETIEVLCDGVFHIGKTLGGPCDDICNNTGICCIKNTDNSVRQIPDFIKECECSALAANASAYIWTPKGNGIESLLDVNCTNAFNGLGPCCDGVGNCTPNVTEATCVSQNGYFQGLGLGCSTTLGILRCSGGTGGCCNSTTHTCANGITGSYCISAGHTYFGYDIPCSYFNC